MKLAILLAILFFLGCKKETSITNKNIEGSWKYVGYSGGFAGLPFTQADPQGPYMEINTNQLIVAAGLQGPKKCMQYQADSSSLTISDTSFLMPMSATSFYLSISHDTLALYPKQCYDCFTAYYVPSAQHYTCN